MIHILSAIVLKLHHLAYASRHEAKDSHFPPLVHQGDKNA